MNSFFKLLTWACAVALVACKSDETAEQELRFGTPVVTEISGTTATVSCPVSAGIYAPELERVGFAYGKQGEAPASFIRETETEVNQGTVVCRLNDLTPGTEYEVYAFFEVGSLYVQSTTAEFTTAEVEPGEVVLEITSLVTLSVPAAGGDQTIRYKVINPLAGESVAAACPSGWIRAFDYSQAGTISFIVDANTGAERRAEVAVTYPGAAPRTVVVEQQAVQTPPRPEGQVLTLTPDMEGWPASYSPKTVTLGAYRYDLSNVGIFGSKGIQFKSDAGTLSNAEDMGAIAKIEVVYASDTRGSDRNIGLFLGATKQPDGNRVEATVSGDTHTFDCSGMSHRYFKLANGTGVCYVKSITIYCGEVTPPDPQPEKPSFGVPTASQVTKNSVTLSCSLSYAGDETITEVYFSCQAAGGTAQRVDVGSVAPGTKSVQMTGLSSSTRYSFRLWAVVGSESYSSDAGSFTTYDESGKPAGNMPYPGWAELPLETTREGDYHYLHKFSDGKRNYTVCYSEDYHCAVWTAHPMHSWYTSGNAGRASFGYDPQISEALQPLLSGTYSPSTYHRGHMVASSDRQRSKAMNKQVFYYTNMAPQIQNEFNGGIWNQLERKIQGTYMCSDTLYVVTGSYFGDPSKTCKDSAKKKTVVVPTHFYKVLLRSKNGNTGKPLWELPASELKCCAFWFEHSTRYGTTGKPSREHMMRVDEVEQKTGFTFFPNVPNAPKGTMNPSEWGM